MVEVCQELMTPREAARWFRRSISWLRRRTDLVRLGRAGGQPLYHVQVCRAYVFGKLCGQEGAALLRTQLVALAAACGVPPEALKVSECGEPRVELEGQKWRAAG